MEPVDSYVQQIDRLLSAGVAMFPEAKRSPAVESAADAAPVTPDGQSALASAAQQAAARYHDVDTRIAELTESIDQAVKFAAAQAIQAGIEARSIRVAANSQAEAIYDTVKSSDIGQLVSTMDERLAAMQDHIASTREHLRAAATQIRQLSVELTAAAARR